MMRRRRLQKREELARLAFTAFLPNLSMLAAYRLLIVSGIYSSARWLDNPLHLLGGAGLAWAFLVFWRWAQKKRKAPALPYWVAVAFSVGVAATIGIVWEQYEFIWDMHNSGGWLTPSVDDFIKDLTNDMLGAFVFALFAAKRMLRKSPKRRFPAS
jgi:hypothetical protein